MPALKSLPMCQGSAIRDRSRGDGTLLGAARRVGRYGVPILGSTWAAWVFLRKSLEKPLSRSGAHARRSLGGGNQAHAGGGGAEEARKRAVSRSSMMWSSTKGRLPGSLTSMCSSMTSFSRPSGQTDSSSQHRLDLQPTIFPPGAHPLSDHVEFHSHSHLSFYPDQPAYPLARLSCSLDHSQQEREERVSLTLTARWDLTSFKGTGCLSRRPRRS